MAAKARIGLVGFGLVGRQHARAVARSARGELCAVVEPDPSARSGAAALGVPLPPDLDALLAAERPDAVSVVEDGQLVGVVEASALNKHLAQALR